jgi:hypothetical protein
MASTRKSPGDSTSSGSEAQTAVQRDELAGSDASSRRVRLASVMLEDIFEITTFGEESAVQLDSVVAEALRFRAKELLHHARRLLSGEEVDVDGIQFHLYSGSPRFEALS